MFTTEGTEEKIFNSKYLTPGVHEVKIFKITGVSPEDKSPYIEFFIGKRDATLEDATPFRFFVSEKAMKTSLEKIKHIATKVVAEAHIDAIKSPSVEGYAYNLDELLRNKELRMKFSGEEYIKSDGTVSPYPKAVIGLPVFAEALSVNPTKLKYDPTNSYDLKKEELSKPSAESDMVNTQDAGDLPF